MLAAIPAEDLVVELTEEARVLRCSSAFPSMKEKAIHGGVEARARRRLPTSAIAGIFSSRED